MFISSKGEYKVVIIGEGRVGKTSILIRFINDKFDPEQKSTVNASYLQKSVSIGSNIITLNIWDTAGQEIFHALSSLYYRDSDFAVIVYDVTDVESFKRVKAWVDQLKSQVPTCKIVLAANKCDLPWKVDEQQSLELCQLMGITQYSTSAMNGEGINRLFSYIVKELNGSLPDEVVEKPITKHDENKKSDRIKISPQKDAKKKSGGCCG